MAVTVFRSFQVYASNVQARRQLLTGSRALNHFCQKMRQFAVCYFDSSILKNQRDFQCTSCRNYYMKLENHISSVVETMQHLGEANNNLKSNSKSVDEQIFLKELNQWSSCKDIFKFVSSLESLSDIMVAAIFQRLGEVQLQDNLMKSPEELMESYIFKSLCLQLEQESANLSDFALVNSLNGLTKLCVDPCSTLMVRLVSESQERLDKGQMSIKNLCILGEGLFNLGGPEHTMLEQVMNQIQSTNLEDWNVEEMVLVYRTLQIGIGRTGKFQNLLNKMNSFAESEDYQFTPRQTSTVLNALVVLDETQVNNLIIRLCKHASCYIPYFTDDEMINVLEAFIHFRCSDQCFTEALERHVIKFAFVMHPNTISKVMQYCSRLCILSKPIFNAVAETFVYNADNFTISQIVEQVVPFGKLNYLPPCAPSFFRQVERLVRMRLSEFEPHVLLNLLHSCILVKCYPLNFMEKLFSPYFLQQLQAESPSLKIFSQLTQLFLTVQLECPYYKNPGLHLNYQVKSFHTRCESLESKVDLHLFSKVKIGMIDLLGDQKYFACNVLTPYHYTIDIEIKLNEEGFVLPVNAQDEVYERIALCIDDEKRFCANSHNLLGKESIKQRHLKLIGYVVVQIPFFEFNPLNNKNDVLDYLHKKVFPNFYSFHE
ncbi:FAST kinase domain-containing protein 3, mitochondrial isoform X1 [Python bivittatus]|uniref:FAST kinase domain-containing protein 3, mitochondrial isoform X1 n=1 Tax=Python bivittatus TaxID=176946 RepID=A0A9F2WDJ0_PYTBI|nr:FAST kinase domain-containing protein 3, mitochondrial isoform X1 [Python bivittatus]XP_007438555.1 FAST kinase domain-containing protein 3, mitochondrial isoform X1 [Python bivittatus]XP_025029144.1 FAST kinase domain-containing protein 3, mitochondrial isoform X1 [Python bivittatus]XP_025029145.1 FAST kinase domain-containing protein 3, mitochondrial isoform X1 [Python bivittatus]XP_025029146.1 FAST kinase domain-containing protein 3, mitochondrial isoform X1 [Python bivittatus]